MNFVKELLLAFVTVTVVVLIFQYSFDTRPIFRSIMLHSLESGIIVTLGIASIRLIRFAYNKQRNKRIA